MVRHFNTIFIGIFLSVIISIESRPANNDGADLVEIPNKSDTLQILESNVLDSTDNERKEIFSKKLFYNVTGAAGLGLRIPVQVIYDSPPVQAYRNAGEKISSHAANQASPTPTPPLPRRNSKQRNFSADIETIKDKLKKYYLEDALNSSKLSDATNANTDDAFSSLVLNGPELKQIDKTKTALPIILQFTRPKSDNSAYTEINAIVSDKNNTDLQQTVDHKYIVPILEKLEQFNNNGNHNRIVGGDGDGNNKDDYEGQGHYNEDGVLVNSLGRPNQANLPAQAVSIPWVNNYPNQVPYSHSVAADFPATIFYPTNYAYDSKPQQYYWPLEAQRQWPSPFAQYFPVVIRDPFQSVLNYFSDLVEYGPAADVCQRTSKFSPYPPYGLDYTPPFPVTRIKRTIIDEMTDDDSIIESKPIQHFDNGRRRYDQDISSDNAEKPYASREKRNMRKKDDRGKYYAHKLAHKSDDATAEQNKDSRSEAKQVVPDGAPPVRGTDVGPQISKLIVRRGGVAIAGAGGIATAGSGGTAIVGPGGTAFTTPASSGGVAMVGPGGKVVSVPDLTSVLYGRTNGGANVAATGAGHSTFTNKDGEVFTTSDNTGGVALVNSAGGVLGISDRETFDQTSKTKEAATKEVQIPVGARLLTTGPIIYYNPIYPINQRL